MSTYYIPASATVSLVDTHILAKNLYLPSSIYVLNKIITIKDNVGSAGSNIITIKTLSGDSFQDGNSNYVINTNFGFASFLALSNKWLLSGNDTNNVSSGGGVSSLSSIISYGLSTVSAGAINPGVSSLSSIISYGLSSVAAGATNPGVSSLSSIVSYGLSTVAAGWSYFPALTNLDISGHNINNVGNVTANSLNVTVIEGGTITTTSNILVGGSIGIGCNSPSYSLDVAGTAHVKGVTFLENSSTQISSNYFTYSNSTHLIIFASDNENSNNGVYFYNQTNSSIIPASNSNPAMDIWYNGSMYVSVGYSNSSSIQYSTDGYNWIPSSVGFGTQGNGVTYGSNSVIGSNIWVAVGSEGNQNNLFWSVDGSNWIQNTSFKSGILNSVIYNPINNYWLILGENNTGESPYDSIYYTLDPTVGIANPGGSASGGFDIRGYYAAYGNNMWVAVGDDSQYNIQYSLNGSNWYPASNITDSNNSFFNGWGASIAYENNIWIAVGNDRVSRTVYSSSDGSNFTLINNEYNVFIDIKYLTGSSWVATIIDPLNEFLISSDNGSNWFATDLADAPGRINVYNSVQVLSNLVYTSNVIPALEVFGNTTITGTTLLSNSIDKYVTSQGAIFVSDNTNSINSLYFYNQNSIIPGGNSTSIYDVWYNGSLYVAVGGTIGSTIQYSTDGYNWVPSSIGFNNVGMGVTYGSNSVLGSNIWVAVGGQSSNPFYNIFWSLDGSNWTSNVNSFIATTVVSVVYNPTNNSWVLLGDFSGGICYTLDPTGSSFTTATTGGFSGGAAYAAYGNNMWVAVGNDSQSNIQYSSDGLNWYPASNVTDGTNSFFSVGGTGIAYGGGVWLAVGSSTPPNTIYSSSDGSNFTLINSNYGGMYDVKYLGGSWAATVNTYTVGTSNYFLTSSDNGSNWLEFPLTDNPRRINVNTSVTSVPTLEVYGTTNLHGEVNIFGNSINGISKITGNGAQIIVNNGFNLQGNNIANIGYISGNGGPITACNGFVLQGFNIDGIGEISGNNGAEINVSNNLNLKENNINGISVLNTNNLNVSQSAVLGIGRYLVEFAANDNNGLYIYNQNNGTVYPKNTLGGNYDICYNGSIWVAVGNITGATIQYSTDGNIWHPSTTCFVTEGRGVAYGSNSVTGQLWVAVGSNSSNNIFYSYNGIDWTLNNSYISDSLNSVIYNPTENSWLIMSEHTGSTSILYTLDPTGIDFTIQANGGFGMRGNYAAWNGSMWVAVGDMSGNIQYSTDGSNWNPAYNTDTENTDFFTNGGYGIAYGSNSVTGQLWLAVGSGNNNNTIYSSSDGSNFTLINSNYNGVYDIKYLGDTNWVATVNSIVGSETNYFITSSDNGVTWTPINLSFEPRRINVYNYTEITNNTILEVFGATHLYGGLNVAGSIVLENTLLSSNFVYSYVADVASSGGIYNISNTSITSINNSSNMNDIYYNGSLWVAVGSNPSIQYSSDGVTWSTSSAFSIQGNGVSYGSNSVLGSNIWVAVGETVGSRNIFWSLDGSNWTQNTSVETDTLNSVTYSPTYNYWLIMSYSTIYPYTILYTTDPTSPNIYGITNNTGVPQIGQTIPLVVTYPTFTIAGWDVAWNGSLWVAVGQDLSGANILNSSDGSNWYQSYNSTYVSDLLNEHNFFYNTPSTYGGGYGVAYGNGTWIVVGDDGGAANTIYSSSDGSNFTLINSNYEGVYDVQYLGGSSWVATANTDRDGTSNYFMTSSNNGSNWSSIVLSSSPRRINVVSYNSNIVDIYSTLDVFGITNLHGDLNLTNNIVFMGQNTTNNLYVSSNILYYNMLALSGTRQYQPQFISF